jgi:amino acid adenylation domain-containing protein
MTSINASFEAIANSPSHANNIALIVHSNGLQVPYATLNQQSNQLARVLLSLGAVQDQTVVGIAVEDRLERSVVAMMATLKAGAAFVNIPSELPLERRRVMLSYCSVIITENKLMTGNQVEAAMKPGTPVFIVDNDWEGELSKHSGSDLTGNEVTVKPTDAAHLLFTSGSTGTPMPVVTEHSAVMNRLEWMWKDFPFVAGEVAILKTALTFVDFIWEIFGSLGRGIPMVLVTTSERKDPTKLIQICLEHNVTRLTVVPSLLRALFATEPHIGSIIPKLWLWTVSGEALQQSLLEAFHAAAPNATLLNLYGSTEVAGDVTWVSFDPKCPERNGATCPQACTIGVAMDGVGIEVLNPDTLEKVPDGQIGGLYVTGKNTARCYLGFPEQTAKRFFLLPSGERCFYMGDLGYKEPNGSGRFHYTGRKDSQVKIRGQRVNLQEVEKSLTSMASTNSALPPVALAVVIQSIGLIEPQLVSFCSSKTPLTAADLNNIESASRQILPEYQVPLFVYVPALPLLFNGKIDRRVLAESKQYIDAALMSRILRSGATSSNQLASDIEKYTASVFGTVLFDSRPEFVSHIHQDSDFFQLGGSSLSAVQLLAIFRQDGHVGVTLGHLSTNSTVKEIAALLSGGASTKISPAAVSDLYSIEPFTASHIAQGVELGVSVFMREPLVEAMQINKEQLTWFIQPFVSSVAGNNLSFIAVDKSTKQVVGFTFNEDFEVPEGGRPEDPSVGPPPTPKWIPVLSLLESMDHSYVNKYRGGSIPKNDTIHMMMTGVLSSVSSDVAGGLINALEEAAISSGKSAGYKKAVTTCTNTVTAHLSVVEFGYKVLETVSYNSFNVEGSCPFNGTVPGGHNEAVLCELAL